MAQKIKGNGNIRRLFFQIGVAANIALVGGFLYWVFFEYSKLSEHEPMQRAVNALLATLGV